MCSHYGPNYAQVLSEDKTVVDFKLWSAGIADGQNPSTFLRASETERHGSGADIVDDHIDPFPPATFKVYNAYM